jgi:hypothetical protein
MLDRSNLKNNGIACKKHISQMNRKNKKVVSNKNIHIPRNIDDKNAEDNNNFDINVHLNEIMNKEINNPSLNKCVSESDNTDEYKSDGIVPKWNGIR